MDVLSSQRYTVSRAGFDIFEAVVWGAGGLLGGMRRLDRLLTRAGTDRVRPLDPDPRLHTSLSHRWTEVCWHTTEPSRYLTTLSLYSCAMTLQNSRLMDGAMCYLTIYWTYIVCVIYLPLTIGNDLSPQYIKFIARQISKRIAPIIWQNRIMNQRSFNRDLGCKCHQQVLRVRVHLSVCCWRGANT